MWVVILFAILVGLLIFRSSRKAKVSKTTASPAAFTTPTPTQPAESEIAVKQQGFVAEGEDLMPPATTLIAENLAPAPAVLAEESAPAPKKVTKPRKKYGTRKPKQPKK